MESSGKVKAATIDRKSLKAEKPVIFFLKKVRKTKLFY